MKKLSPINILLAASLVLPVLTSCNSPETEFTSSPATAAETAETTLQLEPTQNVPADSYKYTINNEGYTVIVDVNHDNAYGVLGDSTASSPLYAEQRIDNILSGFSKENGATGLNHPNGIATDGKHFAVCDTWNNRVLVWNSLPEENVQADIVIGQKDFTSFTAGIGEDQLNWPVGVAFAGDALIISDAHNDRLLVYDSVPSSNGAPADHVITAINEDEDLIWPWGIWSDGSRLIATSTFSGKVAVWNSFNDAENGGYADTVIETGGTPRTIITDGDYLIVGDHNINMDGQMGLGSHVWLHFPTDNSPEDFIINYQLGGNIIDGNVYAMEPNGWIFIYDSLIDNATENAKVTLFNTEGYNLAGDYNQMVYVDGKTYVTYYNSGVVAIYDGKITEENYLDPIGYLGSDYKVKSTSVENALYQNPVPATDGTSLVFTDDFNSLLCVYKNLPDSENAKPDYVYHFPQQWDNPIDVAIAPDGKMYVLSERAVLIWNKVPTNGEIFDERIEFDHQIGRNRSRIEVNNNNLFIYAEQDGKLYQLSKDFNGSFNNAALSVDIWDATGLTCDEDYLIVTCTNERKVMIFNTSDLSLYGEVANPDPSGWLNQPSDAILLSNGQFVVADQDKIRVWNSMDEAIADDTFSDCFEMGNLDHYSFSMRREGRDQMETPNVASDGSLFRPTYLISAEGHLWVGEFKFSSRLVRYDFAV